jgi:deoxyribonuclease IV
VRLKTLPARLVRPEPLIGAHMSIAGGYDKAIERALTVRARVLQIFTKNTSQWRGRPLAAAEAGSFRAAWGSSGLVEVVAHDSYLINLASPEALLRTRSIGAFADELARCESLGVPYLVTHPGAHMGSGVAAGCDRVAESLDRAREIQPAPSVTGTTLGRTFDELRRIRDGVRRRDLVAFCFDTCHVHAAGYDLVSERGWEETFLEFDDVLGLESLRAFHVNDSKRERGSRVDRHEHIGRGHLGEAPFARILRDPRFQRVPKLLETPKGKDGVIMDRRNLALLRRLAEG